MYGLLCSIAVDWTVVMRQSSWALYWFCFLNLCLIKQIHVGWSFSTNVSIIARSAVSSVVTSQLLTVFNLLGQKKKFSYCQLERCWFIVFYLKKKKKGGRYLPENWQVLLFHLFRLSLQGFSVYIDSQFSEINSKLTIGDLNWVVWKVAGDYRSVFKPGL